MCDSLNIIIIIIIIIINRRKELTCLFVLLHFAHVIQKLKWHITILLSSYHHISLRIQQFYSLYAHNYDLY